MRVLSQSVTWGGERKKLGLGERAGLWKRKEGEKTGGSGLRTQERQWAQGWGRAWGHTHLLSLFLAQRGQRDGQRYEREKKEIVRGADRGKQRQRHKRIAQEIPNNDTVTDPGQCHS